MSSIVGGSPPRVRGKVGLFHPPLKTLGITPACAGKSGNSTGHHPSSGRSPRVCGEKPDSAPEDWIEQGSPPRVRGKVYSRVCHITSPRITPACAGKSPVRPSATCRKRDHPRVCGEKDDPASPRLMLAGSPPRVRGKARRASKTRRVSGDHPRVCGEKSYPRRIARYNTGSPPRVRGKDCEVEEAPAADGITPACAGKRSSKKQTRAMKWDHPRVCGEKPAGRGMRTSSGGSPPRVRGKVEWRYFLAAHTGITPACAGKSQ